MKKPAVCIVSTVRNTGRRMESFLRYHLAIGIRHIFLFYDTMNDDSLSIARKFNQTTIVLPDRKHMRNWRRLNVYPKFGPFMNAPGPTGSVARQMLNTEMAIQMALDMGMDWILHIDDDELFYPGASITQIFQQLPERVGQVVFRNHEAAPETPDVMDPFKEVTLFKYHPATIAEHHPRRSCAILQNYWRDYYFVGHTKGKSAARLSSGLIPDGSHAFKTTSRHPETAGFTDGPGILHYINSAFEQMRRRHAAWGHFPLSIRQPWRDSSNIYGFLARSCNAYKTAGEFGLRMLHRQNIVYADRAEVRFLINEKILFRNTSPSRILHRT